MASFNIEEMTNGQIAEVEELTGKSFSDLFLDGKPSWRLVSALAFITLKPSNPDLTFDAVLNGAVDIVSDVMETPDPKDGNSEK